ncbi:MAG: four helix bundle protein [Ignavibacteria bacterium]|nr:four helix bundle protein [Ignavibacteria bacterium]
MTEQDLRKRTKQFALRVIKLVSALPKSQTGKVVGNQLLRAGTSVGANYRAACRARSQADFISKLGVVLEEADESLYWMELIVESNLFPEKRMDSIMQEANELVSIFSASLKTAKRNK